MQQDLIRLIRKVEKRNNKSFVISLGGFYSKKNNKYADNILDFHYDKMKIFFNKLFLQFEKNQCTILVARRCLLLANMFLTEIVNEEGFSEKYSVVNYNDTICIENKNTKYKNYIINDNGLHLLENFKNDVEKVYIVDDVVIHGRHLDEIRKKVKNIIGGKELKVVVYMESARTIVEPIDDSEIVVFDDAWNDFSIKIVDTIATLNIPYVSYVNSWSKLQVAQEEFSRILKELKSKFIECDFKDSIEKSDGRISKYFVEKTTCKSKGILAKCVRVYYNERTQICNLIPYVELDYNETFVKSILDELNNLLNELNYNSTDDLKRNYATCLFSNCYAKYVFDKYLNLGNRTTDNGWREDVYNVLPMTFGCKLTELLSDYSERDQIMALFSDVKNRDNNISVTALGLTKRVVKNVLTKACNDRWIYREFVIFNKEYYKENKEDKEKQALIRIKELVKREIEHNQELKVIDNEYLMDIILANVLRLCDMGKMSISNCLNKKENKKQDNTQNKKEEFYSSYLEVGELAVNSVKDFLRNDEQDDIEEKLGLFARTLDDNQDKLDTLFYSDYYKRLLGYACYKELCRGRK